MSRRGAAEALAGGAPPSPDPLHLLRLLWQLNHALQAASKRMERELGVTGPQRLVLRLLGESPGLGPGQLARLLHLDPGTVTGVVQRLLRAGLLRTATDPHDRRRTRLALSPRGRQLAASRAGTIEQRVIDGLAALPGEDAAAAARVLASLAEALDAGPAPRTKGRHAGGTNPAAPRVTQRG